MNDTLVIGYGNTLRGDDGVGPRVAEEVARWERPGVRALALHQLLPETAEWLSEVQQVIFIDASVGVPVVQLRLLTPENMLPALGHACDARWLLAQTRDLFGLCSRAWLITIPAENLGFCEGLSPTAEEGMRVALRHVEMLLKDAAGLSVT